MQPYPPNDPKNIDGIPIQQSIYDVAYIRKILTEESPYCFIELGTGNGGIPYLAQKHVSVVYTFDIKDTVHHKFTGITYTFIDIFSPRGSDLVIQLCQATESKVLFCDNGNKVKEFEMFAQYINKGDIVMVHDWPSEIDEARAAPTVKKLSLTPLECDERSRVRAWRR